MIQFFKLLKIIHKYFTPKSKINILIRTKEIKINLNSNSNNYKDINKKKKIY